MNKHKLDGKSDGLGLESYVNELKLRPKNVFNLKYEEKVSQNLLRYALLSLVWHHSGL